MIKTYLISLVSFTVLDIAWLGFIIKDFNMRQLSEIGRIVDGKFNLQYFPAIMVYILMAAAVSFFAIPLTKDQNSMSSWFFTGAMLGLFIYGIYDMTNLATLKNYPWAFALVDIAWGTISFGAVTVITKLLTKS